MTKFEDLPFNIRALLLAKLAVKLRATRFLNLYHLAKVRRIDLMDAWREICRMADQPACEIPVKMVHPDS